MLEQVAPSEGTGAGAIALAQHLLACPPEMAVAALAEAARLGVDAMTHFITLGSGDALVIQRAAEWSDVPFFDELEAASLDSNLMRLDTLARARAVHLLSPSGEITCFAPRFEEVLALSQRRATRPVAFATRRTIRQALMTAQAAALLDDSRQRLVRTWPRATASLELSLMLRAGFAVGLALVVLLSLVLPLASPALLLPFLLLVIVAPALLRLLALMHQPRETDDPPQPDEVLPRYSILVPLRDEANMVPQLAAALDALDYPASKLEVLFLVEQRSARTVEAVTSILSDPRFELVVIPDAAPRTKPKALDYALPLVSGTYVVVYDAEDIPARDQLRRAAARFAAQTDVECLQAALAIDNDAENWLTALFAGEYAGLFGLLLPFLAHHRLPLPLGGTSNHFRLSALQRVGGWDAFNVTEDADLGLRLARLTMRIGTLSSDTREEAPVRLGPWMRQRTRWIKGWMQTMIVHDRHAGELLAQLGWRNMLFVQLHMGSLIISALVHAAFVCGFLARWAITGRPPEWRGDLWDLAFLAVFIMGYGAAFALALLGLKRQGRLDLAAYQVLLPVYWLLHAAAAIRAAVELVGHPYLWNKTQHGETRISRRAP